MNKIPLISICIPSYKRIEYIEKLLWSISIQNFRDFEVIISDDSPDDSVETIYRKYNKYYPITYVKNTVPLGTPENWNNAIRMAKGKWIKLMHDDDWFLNEKSLEIFARNTTNKADFIFCAYENFYMDEDKTEKVTTTPFRLFQLRKSPATLFSRNIIGPPSTTLYRNNSNYTYDRNFKWVVDIDFYIRILKKESFFYINTPLIGVGISGEQVTASCFRVPNVEIPENFSLLHKTGTGVLKNILTYDAWWRLIRNLHIKEAQEVAEYGYKGDVPPVILSMINSQKRLPDFLLKKGVFSKVIMAIHFLLNYSKI